MVVGSGWGGTPPPRFVLVLLLFFFWVWVWGCGVGSKESMLNLSTLRKISALNHQKKIGSPGLEANEQADSHKKV